MSKLLLDTHALLWAVLESPSLSRTAAALLRDPSNEVLISAVSAWEIATKVRLGKLPGAERFSEIFEAAMVNAGYDSLPVTVQHALRAGRFTASHKDPFDRILAAQAIAEDIPMLSNDPAFDLFGVRRIW